MNPDPEATLRAYLRAFETLDPEALLPFYHSPCAFIAPFGVSLAPNAGAARAIASALVEHARTQGFRRSEIVDLEVRELPPNLASLSGVFVRFGADDREIGRFGFSYILRDDGGGWKIAVALAHDPPAGSGV